MLEEISIKNLGIIEDTTLPFTPGLTVITGETGAGKTMLLTALGLLLGKKANPAIVRSGSTNASVEGTWDTTSLHVLKDIEETGAIVEDNQLFINRTINVDGKSRAVVGGKSTPVSLLTSFGQSLVQVHGQADQIRLKNPVVQRELLDNYAGEDFKKRFIEYQTVYKKMKATQATLKEVKLNMVAREREYEQLVYAIKEIEKIQPEAGEHEQLTAEVNLLMNTETIQQALTESMNYLSTEDYTSTDITSGIDSIVRTLQTIQEYDEQLNDYAKQAENIQYQIQDLSSNISGYLTNMDEEAINRLNEAQERLSGLNGLMKRYGPGLDEVIAFWETAKIKAEELNPDTNNIVNLEKELTNQLKELRDIAVDLTKMREEAGKSLSEKVNAELEGLAMSGSKLVIRIETDKTFTSTGLDEVRFHLKTPASTDTQPLEKSASGGELSRIMLSLSLAANDADMVPTKIFDEIDSGIGGSVSIEIGKRLAQLAKTSQVIVVSHLAQVAAFADNHLQVEKTLDGETIATTVKQMNDEEIIVELARMLSGLSDSGSAQEHALELKTLANNFKN